MQSQIQTIDHYGHDKFFRGSLLALDSDQIVEMIDKMEKETDGIRQEALKMSWYMRGGVSYAQALHLSTAERKALNDLIKDNLETTKKTGLPYF